MRFITNILTTASLLSAALGAPSNLEAYSAHSKRQTAAPKAIYFQSNCAQNKVYACKVKSDGTIDQAADTLCPSFSTGGSGSAYLTETSQGSGIWKSYIGGNSLGSQGSVTVGDNYVFVVNAGSNTLTMFSFAASNPTSLTMVGKPVNTLGEFPVSVTYSSALKLACVINGGAVDGVACFKVSPTGLSTTEKATRPLSIKNTTPPRLREGSLLVGGVLFTADSKGLVLFVSGSYDREGWIGHYEVSGGTVQYRIAKTLTKTIPEISGLIQTGTVEFAAAGGRVAVHRFKFNPSDRTFTTTDEGLPMSFMFGDFGVRIAEQKSTKALFITDLRMDRVTQYGPGDKGMVPVDFFNPSEDREPQSSHTDILIGSNNFLYTLAPKTRYNKGGIQVKKLGTETSKAYVATGYTESITGLAIF